MTTSPHRRLLVAVWAGASILAIANTPPASADDKAPEIDAKTLESAGRILSRYDSDKNGALEEAEWSSMVVQPTDYDGNQRISQEEMARKIVEDRTRREAASKDSGSAETAPADKSAGPPDKPDGDNAAAVADRSEPPPATTSPDADSSSTAPAAKGRARRSYRFLSPRERLPDGLPSFFASRDRDGDGQVMMSEFASRWTEATLREFASHDLNNDGVITPAECLRGQKQDRR